MDLNLKGKNVLVTGSSSGIGFEIAKKFYEEGSNVILNGRNKEKLDSSLVKLPGSFAIQADVSDPKEALKLANLVKEKLTSLNIVVCNVGSGKSAPPTKETLYDWQKSMSINLFSATNIIEHLIEPLTISKGVIICISSICGNEFIPGAPITYSCAKAALNHFVKTIAWPLAERGIRINAISPGNIIFPDSSWEEKLKNNKKDVKSYLKNNVALKRFGTPDEISKFACFLASENASFATGSIFTLDGNQTRS